MNIAPPPENNERTGTSASLLSLFLNKIFLFLSSKPFLKRAFPQFFFPPHLRKLELKLFTKMIDDSNFVVEFGSGGSTLAILNKRKRLYSVETNGEFYEYMRRSWLIKRSISKKIFDYIYINIGMTDKWGRPRTFNHIANWSQYFIKPWEEIGSNSSRVDLVYIDGRFRIPACLYSIKMLVMSSNLDCMILFHDYFSRPVYHIVSRFLILIDSENDLAIFRIDKNLDLNEIDRLLNEEYIVKNFE